MEAGRQNSRQPPWEAGAGADVATFGTWLRQQRELREVSLREVADVTKISIRYLEALEQDRFDVLPAPVFAKGFLRQYATYVGLKPDDVVNSYLNALQEQEPQEEEPLRSVGRRTSWEWASGLLLALLVVALLALVAFLAFYAERRRSGADETPPPIAAPPVEVAPRPLAAAATADAHRDIPLLVTMDWMVCELISPEMAPTVVRMATRTTKKLTTNMPIIRKRLATRLNIACCSSLLTNSKSTELRMSS